MMFSKISTHKRFAPGDVVETLSGDGFLYLVGGFVGLTLGGDGLVVLNAGGDDCVLGVHGDGFLFAFGVGLDSGNGYVG